MDIDPLDIEDLDMAVGMYKAVCKDMVVEIVVGTTPLINTL